MTDAHRCGQFTFEGKFVPFSTRINLLRIATTSCERVLLETGSSILAKLIVDITIII